MGKDKKDIQIIKPSETEKATLNGGLFYCFLYIRFNQGN